MLSLHMPRNSAHFLGCVERSEGVSVVFLAVQLKRCSVVWSFNLQSGHRMLCAVSNLLVVDRRKVLYPDLSWASVHRVIRVRPFSSWTLITGGREFKTLFAGYLFLQSL